MLADLKKSLGYMKNPNVATWKKMAAVGAAGLYFAMPADLIPDVIPVLGQVDDVAVIALLSKGFNKLAEMDLQKNVQRENVYNRLNNLDANRHQVEPENVYDRLNNLDVNRHQVESEYIVRR